MTATFTGELQYMFAHIRDGQLVQDSKHRKFSYGGPGDSWKSFVEPIRNEHDLKVAEWVTLVPPTPILYAPSNTLWDRIAAERPSVEYYAGHWQNWEDGPLPINAPIPRDRVYISVFLVPESQYAQLNEERDQLTEVRVQNVSKHSRKAPSLGAQVSTFVKDQDSNPIAIGRPKYNDFYHIPISLFHSAFAQFKDDLISGPIDSSLSPLAFEWSRELSAFFDDKKKRETKFHELLSKLLGCPLSKKRIGDFKTDGGIDPTSFLDLLVKPLLVEVKIELTQGSCDAVFEIILYDLEGVRLILTDDGYKGDWQKTRLPSVLILHNGPNIQALGAVYLAEQYVEVLSTSLPLYFSEYDTHAMENLLRFMTALRRLFDSLCTVYDKPNEHAVDSNQVNFPYPHSYQSLSGITLPFTYVDRVSDIHLVFTARTDNGKDIIVKFGNGHYGVDAHKAAAKSGLAPALLGHSPLDGGMWMVAMETLEEGFEPCDQLRGLNQPCKNAINESLRRFHDLGFVHGDLRDTNVFVRKREGEDRWDCQIIDYDWAGREGDALYPIGVYNTNSVWRPERYLDAQKITAEHDRLTVAEFLWRRTIVNRF